MRPLYGCNEKANKEYSNSVAGRRLLEHVHTTTNAWTVFKYWFIREKSEYCNGATQVVNGRILGGNDLDDISSIALPYQQGNSFSNNGLCSTLSGLTKKKMSFDNK